MRLKAFCAAALATVLALAAIPVQGATSGPLADLEAAQARLDAAEKALEGYEDTGMLGFYRHNGSADAVRILTDPDVTKYVDHVRLDDPDGPTALTKVRSALEFVKECNRLRVGEGLDELKVSDVSMAVAEAQDSYYMYDEEWNDDDTAGHKLQFAPMRENLDMLSTDPFDAWYVAEKENYETGEGDTGHYKNIIKNGYYVTGFADGRSGEYDYDYRVQNFITDDKVTSIKDYSVSFDIGDTYTPDEYESRLDDYAQWLSGLESEKTAAEKAVEAAEVALTHVSGTVADTAGNPIAGAAVTLSGPKSLTATTGEDGSFDLDAGDGDWTLTVTADGYVDGTQDDIHIGDSQTRTWTGLDIRLDPATATVSGVVSDGHGNAYEGIRIAVTDSSGVTVIATGEDGTWSATARAGSVEVEYLDLPDGYEAASPTSTRLDLGAGETATFSLTVKAKTGVAVVTATDPSGPVEGVSVTVGDATGETGTDGSLTLNGLEAGWHEVRYKAADGLETSGPSLAYIPAGGAVDLSVTVKAPGTSMIPVTGHVPWILLTCLAAPPLAVLSVRLKRHADLG